MSLEFMLEYNQYCLHFSRQLILYSDSAVFKLRFPWGEFHEKLLEVEQVFEIFDCRLTPVMTIRNQNHLSYCLRKRHYESCISSAILFLL